MFKFILLSFVLIVNSYAFDGRIVNGFNADLGQVPYIVSLQKNDRHFCGGSILDAYHVLTAAHCIKTSSTDEVYIQYGVIDIRTKVNRIRVSQVISHEKYSPKEAHANDIAILKLANSIKFGPNVKRTVLPKQGEPIPENKVSMLAGWGRDKSGGSIQTLLQIVYLNVYSDDECEKLYREKAIRKYHLCSGVDEGGKGQCGADSGGPLYSEGKQIGIVSWSVKPCASKGKPGVYVKVSSYVDWIKRNINTI